MRDLLKQSAYDHELSYRAGTTCKYKDYRYIHFKTVELAAATREKPCDWSVANQDKLRRL